MMQPTLTINLANLRRNWQLIADKVSPAACAAVVKANGYGLGVQQIATALYAQGCREFFVATLEEGIELREVLASCYHKETGDETISASATLPQITSPELRNGKASAIYVFNGPHEEEVRIYQQHHLTPILNTIHQARFWEGNCILHVDTGMNRLGIRLEEARELAEDKVTLKRLDLRYIMSHLACNDIIDHPMTREQLKRFNQARKLFPDVPCSVGNSFAGLGQACYHFDLIRPGVMLYGSQKPYGAASGIQPVITLEAPVIQLRQITEAGTVGYGATANVNKGDRIAILPVGYADGYPRALSNKAQVAFNGKRAPLIGRVSMDLIAVDVTQLPEVKEGSIAEIIGEHIPLDLVAELADTIAYEILTNLGARYKRVYME